MRHVLITLSDRKLIVLDTQRTMHDLSAVVYHFGGNNNDEFELFYR